MYATAPAGYYASWFNLILSLSTSQNVDLYDLIIKSGQWTPDSKKLRAIITIPAGNTIYSTDPTKPAIILPRQSGLRFYDSIILINKGNIIGAGGHGGAGGIGSSGTANSVKNGSSGGRGGTAIRAERSLSLINEGFISGGAGGGGGGGGNAVYAGLEPTGQTTGPWCTIDAWITSSCNAAIPTSVAPCGAVASWDMVGTGNDCPCEIDGECKQYERVCKDYERRCAQRKKGKCIQWEQVCVKYGNGNCIRWGCVNDQRNCTCGGKTRKGQIAPCRQGKVGDGSTTQCCGGQPSRCGTQCRGTFYIHACRAKYTGNAGGKGGNGASFNIPKTAGAVASGGSGAGGNGGDIGDPGLPGVSITGSSGGSGGSPGYYIEGVSLVSMNNSGTLKGDLA